MHTHATLSRPRKLLAQSKWSELVSRASVTSAIFTNNYNDVIMSAMASQITSRLLTQPFIHAQIKESIKTPRHWPLWGEFTGDRWIPRTMASNAENVSIWRHHVMSTFDTVTQVLREFRSPMILLDDVNNSWWYQARHIHIIFYRNSHKIFACYSVCDIDGNWII